VSPAGAVMVELRFGQHHLPGVPEPRARPRIRLAVFVIRIDRARRAARVARPDHRAEPILHQPAAASMTQAIAVLYIASSDRRSGMRACHGIRVCHAFYSEYNRASCACAAARMAVLRIARIRSCNRLIALSSRVTSKVLRTFMAPSSSTVLSTNASSS